MPAKVQFREITVHVGTDKRAVRGVSLDSFLEWVQARSGTVVTIDQERLRVLCENHGATTSGAVINLQGRPNFETLDPLTLIRAATNSQSSTEAYSCNVWAINRMHHIGVYQSQAQTYGVSEFRRVMSHLYDLYVAEQRLAHAQALVDQGADPDRANEKAKHAIAGRISISPHMTTDEFLALVAKLATVKSFNYSVDVSKIQSTSTWFGMSPSFRDAKLSSQRILMKNGAKPKPVVDFVRSHQADLKSGKAIGVDGDGIQQVYQITQHAEVIGDMPGDQWGLRLPPCLLDVATSDALGTVMRYLNDRVSALNVD